MPMEKHDGGAPMEKHDSVQVEMHDSVPMEKHDGMSIDRCRRPVVAMVSTFGGRGRGGGINLSPRDDCVAQLGLVIRGLHAELAEGLGRRVVDDSDAVVVGLGGQVNSAGLGDEWARLNNWSRLAGS